MYCIANNNTTFSPKKVNRRELDMFHMASVAEVTNLQQKGSKHLVSESLTMNSVAEVHNYKAMMS